MNLVNLVTVSNAQITIKRGECPECEKEVYELYGIGLELESCPHCHFDLQDETEMIELIDLYIFVDPVTGTLKAVNEEELDHEIRARL